MRQRNVAGTFGRSVKISTWKRILYNRAWGGQIFACTASAEMKFCETDLLSCERRMPFWMWKLFCCGVQRLIQSYHNYSSTWGATVPCSSCIIFRSCFLFSARASLVTRRTHGSLATRCKQRNILHEITITDAARKYARLILEGIIDRNWIETLYVYVQFLLFIFFNRISYNFTNYNDRAILNNTQ